MDERVFCFPAKILSEVGEFSGLEANDFGKYVSTILSSKDLTFIERSSCETDPSFKQIIPYQLLRSYKTDKYFVYRRSPKGGEDRLHAKLSLGIGGHINETDKRSTGPLTYSVGRLRELHEEVELWNVSTEHKIIGVLYDPASLVGQVHFGIIHQIDIEKPEVNIIDEALADNEWLSVTELSARYEYFERWSQLVIDHLTNKEAKPWV